MPFITNDPVVEPFISNDPEVSPEELQTREAVDARIAAQKSRLDPSAYIRGAVQGVSDFAGQVQGTGKELGARVSNTIVPETSGDAASLGFAALGGPLGLASNIGARAIGLDAPKVAGEMALRGASDLGQQGQDFLESQVLDPYRVVRKAIQDEGFTSAMGKMASKAPQLLTPGLDKTTALLQVFPTQAAEVLRQSLQRADKQSKDREALQKGERSLLGETATAIASELTGDTVLAEEIGKAVAPPQDLAQTVELGSNFADPGFLESRLVKMGTRVGNVVAPALTKQLSTPILDMAGKAAKVAAAQEAKDRLARIADNNRQAWAEAVQRSDVTAPPMQMPPRQLFPASEAELAKALFEQRAAEAGRQTPGMVQKGVGTVGKAAETGGKLVETATRKIDELADKYEGALSLASAAAGASGGASGALLASQAPGAIRKVARWGQNASRAGTALRSIAGTDWSSSIPVWRQIAKDPDAPQWLVRGVTANVVGKLKAGELVEKGLRVGTDLGKGILEGAATDAVLTGMDTSKSGEEIGGEAGTGGLFGALGTLPALKSMSNERKALAFSYDSMRKASESIAAGANPLVIAATPDATMHSSVILEQMFRGMLPGRKDLKVDLMDGAQFAQASSDPGAAAYFDENTGRIAVNLESIDADGRQLHEVGHALMTSVAGSNPAIVQHFQQLLGADGLARARQDYQQALGRTVPQDDAFIVGELFSEALANGLRGANLNEALPTVLGRTQTQSFFRDADVRKAIKDPNTLELVRQQFQAASEFRPAVDMEKEPGVKLRPAQAGNHPALPTETRADGTQGNDFVDVTNGQARETPVPVVRARVRSRRREVLGLFPDVPPSGNVNPQASNVGVRQGPSGMTEKTGTRLGEQFYTSARSFGEGTKNMLRRVEQAITNNETLAGWYQQIGEGDGWSASVRESLGAMEAQYKDFMPYAFKVDKQGNLLVQNYSLSALERKAAGWAGRQGPLSLEMWNGDIGSFRQDVQTYLKNHAEGRPGSDGLGDMKRNLINVFLVGGNRTFEALNPLRAQAKGRDRQGIVRSYRADRLQTVEPSAITGFEKPDYNKQVRNLSPDIRNSPEVIPMDQLRRPDGALGTQGFSKEGVASILTGVVGLDLPKGATLKQMVEAFKNSPEAIQRLRDFTQQYPIAITSLPDGTTQINDGHHRAFLLDQAGETNVPITRGESTAPSVTSEALSETLPPPPALVDTRYSPNVQIINDLQAKKDAFEQAQQKLNSFPFGGVGQAFDRSFHLTKLVRRLLDGMDSRTYDRMAAKAQERGDQAAVQRYQARKQKLSSVLNYTWGTLADLTASLPEYSAKDLSTGGIDDPFRVLKEYFPGGQKRPIADVLKELAAVVESSRLHEPSKFPTQSSGMRDVANIAEVIRDFADVDQSTIDELFTKTWGRTEAEQNSSEAKLMGQLTNPEFNDVTKQGSATVIRPITTDSDVRNSPPVKLNKKTAIQINSYRHAEQLFDRGYTLYGASNDGFDDSPNLIRTRDELDRYDPENMVAMVPKGGDPVRNSPNVQTDTPEFKKWFTGSAVVNEDGSPRVMYHGTISPNIGAFRSNRARGQIAGHFAFEPDFASDFASFGHWNVVPEEGINPTVYPVYLSVKKLFDVRDDAARAEIKRLGPPTPRGHDWTTLERPEVVQELRNKGYDGYLDFEKGDRSPPTGIAVFQPTQIKSAIGNEGTFDPSNPDIRKSPEVSSEQLEMDFDKAVDQLGTEEALSPEKPSPSRAPRQPKDAPTTFSITASRIKRLLKRGPVNPIGMSAATPQDRHAVAALFRNPAFEAMRWVFLKEGKVVAVANTTVRRPEMVYIMTKNVDEQQMAKLAAESGADSVFWTHNHPSGNSRPSDPDINATRRFWGPTLQSSPLSKLNFLGHIVTNHTDHHLIDVEGRISLINVGGFHDPMLKKPVWNDRIDSPSALARAGAALANGDNPARLILFLDPRLNVKAIGEISPNLDSLKFAEEVRKYAKATGATSAAAYGHLGSDAPMMEQLVRDGILVDAHIIGLGGVRNAMTAWTPLLPSPPEALAEDQIIRNADEKLLFSPQVDRNLVALHNTTEEGVRSALKLGGIPVPSLGVTKKDKAFTGFGDITLIADKATVDPQADPRNRLFNADVYSPRQPRPFQAVSKGARDRLSKRINALKPLSLDTWNDISSGERAYDQVLEKGANNAADTHRNLSRSLDVQAAFLTEKGVQVPRLMKDPDLRNRILDRESLSDPRLAVLSQHPDDLYDFLKTPEGIAVGDDIRTLAFEERGGAVGDLSPEQRQRLKALMEKTYGAPGTPFPFRDADSISSDLSTLADGSKKVVDRFGITEWIRDQIKPREAEFSKWVDGLTADIFEPDQKLIRGTKKVPYTLENITDAMTGKIRGQEEGGLTHSLGRARSESAVQFRDLDQARAAEGSLMTREGLEPLRRERQNQFDQVVEALAPFDKYPDRNGFDRLDNLSEAMGKIAKRPALAASVLASFDYTGISPQVLSDVRKFALSLRDDPTEYFESKPQRAVGLSEFKAAIVPEGTSPDVVDALKQAGLAVETYTDNANRIATVERVSSEKDLLFSPKVSFDQPSDKVMDTSAINLLHGTSTVLPPGTKEAPKTLDTIAKNLQEAAVTQWGRIINSYDITPAEYEVIADNAMNECVAALQASGKNAFDWYTTAIARASVIMSVLHPELKDDATARASGVFPNAKAAHLGMTMAMAITSQNLSVDSNSQYAEEQFSHLLKTGKFDPEKEYGTKATSISSNLALANVLIEKLGWEGADKFLAENFTVKELSEVAKQIRGKKVTISGRADDIVQGAALFGPKIGQGFLQNLRGNFVPVTIDLWMRRTWGRWTGDVMEVDPLTPERVSRLLEGARAKGLVLPQQMKTMRTVARRRKGGSTYTTLSDALVEKIRDDRELRDVIFSVTEDLVKEWDSRYKSVKKFAVRPEDLKAVRDGSLSFDALTDRQMAILKRLDVQYGRYVEQQKTAPEGTEKLPKDLWRQNQLQALGHTELLTNKDISSIKPEWASSAIVIQNALGPIDVPNDQDREVITRLVNDIRGRLKQQGIETTNADIQAILWYPEKDIWAKLSDGTSDSDLKQSYDTEFLKIAEARGLGDQARAALQQAESDRTARTGSSPGAGETR